MKVRIKKFIPHEHKHARAFARLAHNSGDRVDCRVEVGVLTEELAEHEARQYIVHRACEAHARVERAASARFGERPSERLSNSSARLPGGGRIHCAVCGGLCVGQLVEQPVGLHADRFLHNGAAKPEIP